MVVLFFCPDFCFVGKLLIFFSSFSFSFNFFFSLFLFFCLFFPLLVIFSLSLTSFTLYTWSPFFWLFVSLPHFLVLIAATTSLPVVVWLARASQLCLQFLNSFCQNKSRIGVLSHTIRTYHYFVHQLQVIFTVKLHVDYLMSIFYKLLSSYGFLLELCCLLEILSFSDLYSRQ